MLDIDIFEIFPNLKSKVREVDPSDKIALDWWNSLRSEVQSKWFDKYYIENKTGLNLQEIVKLYKKQTGNVTEVKNKRPRITIKK
jgi:hypothetical protein